MWQKVEGRLRYRPTVEILAMPSADITTIGRTHGAELTLGDGVAWLMVRPNRIEFKNKDLLAVNGMRCRLVQTAHHMLATSLSRSTINVWVDHWVPQD